jgi:hypothetical protein
MTERKQPQASGSFANIGRPAFAGGGDRRKAKIWAIVCTVGFAIFWVSGLFLVAEVFGPRELAVWPMILTPVGLIVGMVGRVMMAREGN